MADANKINGVFGKDISKMNTIPTNTIYKVGNTITKFDVLPTGLILPLNDSSVPSGWEAFNAANDRLIIGAGDTYAPGATGGTAVGAAVGNLPGGTGTGGDHHPISGAVWFNGNDMNGYVGLWKKNDYTNGAHQHDIGLAYLNQIDKNEYKLIRSTQENDKLPSKTGVFSTSSLAGLGMSVLGNNKLFGSYSSVRELSKSGTVSLATAGSHYHTTDTSWARADDTGGPNYIDYQNVAGDHSSSEALTTINQNFKRLLLSLWSHSTTQIEAAPGMIAMWESLTPPDGWLICNGTNGTPDLRNNFIQNCPSGSENTTSQGNNQVTCGISTTVTHNVSHTHTTNHNWFSQNSQYIAISHGTYSWSHNHTINSSGTYSFLPAYYALSFIMKEA